MKILAIDPGTQKTGIAVMYTDKDDEVYVYARELIKASGSVGKRCEKIVDKIVMAADRAKPDLVICEYPALYGGSETGMAARESGRITILFTFCGMIYEALRAKRNLRFVTAIKWKGNLKKHHTASRIDRDYGIRDTEDIIDAIGIGDWYMKEGADLDWDGPFLKT